MTDEPTFRRIDEADRLVHGWDARRAGSVTITFAGKGERIELVNS